jgi:DNA-binding MarR family transcriptional regulator
LQQQAYQAVTGQAPPRSELAQALAAVARAQRAYLGHLLGDLDLRPGQEALLPELDEHKGCTQRELARALGLDPSTVSRSVARLERLGLVRRAPDPSDHRARRILLTETGDALRAGLVEAWAFVDDLIAFDFPDDERRDLVARLTGIAGQLREAAGRPARDA